MKNPFYCSFSMMICMREGTSVFLNRFRIVFFFIRTDKTVFYAVHVEKSMKKK
jgi:hypothetical protein